MYRVAKERRRGLAHQSGVYRQIVFRGSNFGSALFIYVSKRTITHRWYGLDKRVMLTIIHSNAVGSLGGGRGGNREMTLWSRRRTVGGTAFAGAYPILQPSILK